jgi:hypothetical protein
MIDLQVHQQFGRIGLNITPFQYDLTIRPPDLQVQQQPAEITLEQPAATLEINLTPARESLGYSGIDTLQRVFTQDAMAASNAGIDRRVQEGNELGAIEKRISVAQVVAQGMEPRDKHLELVSIAPIQITTQERPIGWQVQTGGVHIELTQGTVQGNLQYGSVHSYLEQEPKVQIETVGSVIDTQR